MLSPTIFIFQRTVYFVESVYLVEHVPPGRTENRDDQVEVQWSVWIEYDQGSDSKRGYHHHDDDEEVEQVDHLWKRKVIFECLC